MKKYLLPENGNFYKSNLHCHSTFSDGKWTPEKRQEFVATLDHSVLMMTTAFELWDFGVWTPILKNTFYHGLADRVFSSHVMAAEDFI